MNNVKPNAIWPLRKAVYGLREAPRLWHGERDQHLRDLEFQHLDRRAHLVQRHMHPSLSFIVEGPIAQSHRIPPL